VPTVTGIVLNTALAAAVTESSATVSVCRVCSAQHATSLVQQERGVQTAFVCATVPYFNTLPAVILRSE